MDVCRANVSSADVERNVESDEVVSVSRDSDCGIPRHVAISRCKARRWPSLKFNMVRSSSVISTTVSQL